MTFPVIDIPLDAREDTEQLGSKPKFWVLLDGTRWLFKEARQNTGEDWAEKAAAEIARAIGISAANVELGSYEGRRGSLSQNFVNVNAGQALVHGNEILALRIAGYDKTKAFRQSDHTLPNIDRALRDLFSGDAAVSIFTVLAGYLVLDALIGNTDRHHENWGLLFSTELTGTNLSLSVAPSFDHASSLGRELQDSRRAEFLGAGRIPSYIQKGRGGIFRDPAAAHGENPLRLVQLAARAYPEYFGAALERVRMLDPASVAPIFDALPNDRASPIAKQFATQMVLSARLTLIEILK